MKKGIILDHRVSQRRSLGSPAKNNAITHELYSILLLSCVTVYMRNFRSSFMRDGFAAQAAHTAEALIYVIV